MARWAQAGIALSTLGLLMLLIGLYPGLTGIQPTPGVGMLQLVPILLGFALFIFGALIYVKYTFYTKQILTLTQSIGIRLAMTGLLLAALAGLADVLGYGSHGAQMEEPNLFGALQATGIITSYALACLGVLVYALGGRQKEDE
jgi:hypothetical protein